MKCIFTKNQIKGLLEFFFPPLLRIPLAKCSYMKMTKLFQQSDIINCESFMLKSHHRKKNNEIMGPL